MLLRSRSDIQLSFGLPVRSLGMILLFFLILCTILVANISRRNTQQLQKNTASLGFSLSADTGFWDANSQKITLEIDFDDSLRWNGQSISASELRQRLSRIAVYAPELTIKLKAHRFASFSHVFETMKVLQELGIQRVNMS